MQSSGLLLRLVGCGTSLLLPTVSQAQTAQCATERSWTSRTLVELVASRAVQRAGLSGVEPTRELATRARWSALLPRVTLRVGRGLSYGLNTTTSMSTTDRVSSDDSMHFEVAATFDFDRMVSSSIELDAIRAETQRTERRRGLEREVLETLTLLERDRALRAQCLPTGSNGGTATPEIIHARLRVEWWTNVEWVRLQSM